MIIQPAPAGTRPYYLCVIYHMYHEHVPMEDIVDFILYANEIWIPNWIVDIMLGDPSCPITQEDMVYLRMAIGNRK